MVSTRPRRYVFILLLLLQAGAVAAVLLSIARPQFRVPAVGALCLVTYGAARLAPAWAVIRPEDSAVLRVTRIALFLAVPILLVFVVAIVWAVIASGSCAAPPTSRPSWSRSGGTTPASRPGAAT